MKKVYILSTLSIFLTSCSGASFLMNRITPVKVVVIVDSTFMYAGDATLSGKVKPIYLNDTLIATSKSITFYGVKGRDTSGFVLIDEVNTLEEFQNNKVTNDYLGMVKLQPTTFSINKNKAEMGWGRAQGFIGKYSSMKLEIATNYILQTFNPAQSHVDFGYYVTRTPSDSTDEFSIECVYGNMFTQSDATLNAKIMAYYIATGVIKPEFVKK
jgi:hypothetical protein